MRRLDQPNKLVLCYNLFFMFITFQKKEMIQCPHDSDIIVIDSMEIQSYYCEF